MSKKNLSILRNMKIGLFHLGSGMADVLITGVWNRIMISDLGFRAAPVSLLASLRYFLAPLSVWAGQMSDRYAIFGYHRLFWIWTGRALMALSMMSLGWFTTLPLRGEAVGLGFWLGATLSMLLFSLGNALSGSTFLALVYDRAPEHQRGRAVGIVWTFLLTGFAVGGAFFATLLPTTETATGPAFDSGTLQNLFITAALVMSMLWFVALIGEEQRQRQDTITPSEEGIALRQDLKLVTQNEPLRLFMAYLALSMAFSFSQDAILEPFAGDVFNLSAEVTTRFAAYWGTTAIIGSIAFLALSRRFPWLNNTLMSQVGVVAIAATFLLYVVAAYARLEAMIIPGLLLLGLGLGIWNIGTLGLMMQMSPDGKAGTFLGFWTLVVTLSRGFGVSGGGVVRDIVLIFTGDIVTSYAVVFALGAVGLGAAYWFLVRTDTEAFRERHTELDQAQMIGAALD